MLYGIIQKLIAKQLNDHEDRVLIESPFKETTRSGTYVQSVLLGVTPKKIVVAMKSADFSDDDLLDKCEAAADRQFEIRSVYPIQAVKFSIFKRSNRQSLKACFQNSTVRYYELGSFKKRKIFWKLWCNHAKESSGHSKLLWPFASDLPGCLGHSEDSLAECDIDCIEIQAINSKNQEKNRKKWTDKYLYLGSIREKEDIDRPQPLPGLGTDEHEKLMYLKPHHPECWEQPEHWNKTEFIQETMCDYNAYTYTGEPTSNVTYTSLMTTVSID